MHQLLVAAGSYVRSVDISGVLQDTMSGVFAPEAAKLVPQMFLRPADNMLPLKEGDELSLEPLETQVKHDRKFAFSVSIDRPQVIEPEPVTKTLQDMTNLVGGVIGAFAPYL
jgi:hypothetical protein